jgi:hypothetical protein
MAEGDQPTLEEQLDAERDRADRAEIEAQIMLEMVSKLREIAVSYGLQVIAVCKQYVEEVKPMVEDRAALREEIERRLVEKREREKKQEDES